MWTRERNWWDRLCLFFGVRTVNEQIREQRERLALNRLAKDIERREQQRVREQLLRRYWQENEHG